MFSGKIIVVLCAVALLVLLWDILLQVKIREIDKKIKRLEEKVAKKERG